MKTIGKTITVLIPAAFLIGPISADMAPQPQVIFTLGLENTFAADWQGVAGRVYFMQWSLDLETWFYAPFIDFGDGMHSRGMAGTSDKGFYRLHCVDDPEIASLDEAMNADFDGDGLSNIFEVTYGYGPYDTASTSGGNDNALDPEGDGMTNATENARGLNPMGRDNPKLLLQVTEE
jgi:hypothetical protein